MVGISTTSPVRAKTLLGLEENNGHHSCQEHITRQSVMDGLDGERDSSFGDIRRFEQYKREDSKPVPSSLGTSTSRRTESTNEVIEESREDFFFRDAHEEILFFWSK